MFNAASSSASRALLVRSSASCGKGFPASALAASICCRTVARCSVVAASRLGICAMALSRRVMFGNIRTGKALLRAIVLIQRENMRRSFWLEAQSFEQMHEGLFSFFKDCFRLVEGLFFLRRDAFFNGYAVIQIEKRHDMLVQKFLHTLVVSHKKHPKTSKGNRVAHNCLQCRSPMFAKIREPSKSRVRNFGKMFAIC